MKVCEFFGRICSRELLVALLLGQLLSLLLCGTAVTSGLLSERGFHAPTTQTFLNYFLLCLVYTVLLALRSGEKNLWPVLKSRGWKYAILGLIDVEANFLVVKAYEFTTVTSVQILDCFTIPVVMVLSWFILKMRYRLLHLLGVVICLGGVGAIIGADIITNKNSGQGSNKFLGDVLVLVGAALYGVSNVGQEFAVRSFDRVEYLGMIGMFSSVFSGIQVVIVERDAFSEIDSSLVLEIGLILAGYVICLFTLYSVMPVVMKLSSATAVNLSILSADFYALLFGIFLFHYQFHVLYIAALVLVISGVVVYNVVPPVAKIEHYTPQTDSTEKDER